MQSKESKKVAIIVHVPASEGGGGFYNIRTKAALLEKNGFTIDVYEPYSDKHPYINDKVEYHDYNSALLVRLAKIKGIFPILMDIKFEDKYDYIILFSFFYLRLFLRRTNFEGSKRIILCTYDMLFPEKIYKKILRKIAILWYRLLNYSNMSILVENDVEEKMLWKSGMKIYKSPPLLESNSIKFYDNRNDKFTVIFIGRLEKRKGAELLFNILRELKCADIVFRIVGDITSEFNNIVEKLKNKDNILFYGRVSEDKKWDLLRTSDLGIMLSTEESYSLVTREMLLAGLPVVTTWSPANEIFGYGVIVARQHEVCNAIMYQMKKWKDSYEDYIQLRHSIYDTYVNKFSKDKLEKDFLNIFND
ncbi:MAG: glycosyltransferase family 4 protein [Nitrososphaeria archaeon]